MPQLINAMHINKSKEMKTSKIIMIIKDENGEKSFKYIDNPKFSYYVNKPMYKDEGFKNFIEVEKVNKVTCYYDELYKNMAYNAVNENTKLLFQEAMSSGEDVFYKLRRMHLDYNFHGSDKNIVDYYISKYYAKYNPDENLFGITKAFVDIEVDGSEIIGFPDAEVAPAPINIITMVCNNGNVYSYCLKYDTDTYKECMDRKEEVIQSLKDRYKAQNLDLNFYIYEYTNELDLIKGFFHTINEVEKPDFISGWNSGSFDFPTIINRIKNLKANPDTVCCPKELLYKKAKYTLDKRNSDPCDRNDVTEIAGYSVWLDSMLLYANLRKSAKEDSYALDYIGEKLLGIRKDEVEGDIKNFHFVDYEKFMKYNIQDTVMLLQLENKNKDIDLFQKVSVMTETRITHALKKTVCLRNLADKFYREKGLIISNNKSKLWNNDGTKIQGAFVGDPNHTDFNGMIINNRYSKFLYEDVIDFDLSSLYPSIILSFNVSPETCIGRMTIPENGIGNEEDFLIEYSSGDIVNFGKKWFNLPGIDELLDIIDKEC